MNHCSCNSAHMARFEKDITLFTTQVTQVQLEADGTKMERSVTIRYSEKTQSRVRIYFYLFPASVDQSALQAVQI